jgi:GNAT superfamily N-acetyltransferase
MIRRLLPSDMESAIRLTRAAGWNQVPSDWERLLRLEPEGCFALESEGQVAATTTALCYGQELAWIGMVLTAPEFRRRGFADALIAKALQYVEQRGVSVVKLDATDKGIGLYRRHGFMDECEIQRWRREPGPTEGTEIFSYVPDFAYDRAIFGTDRATVLETLEEFDAVSLPGGGYAMGRPGFLASYFGPCVVHSPAAARRLLRWFLTKHPDKAIFWDLFPHNKEAVQLAQEFGFTPVRTLVRMHLSRPSARSFPNPAEVFAIAGFELG